MHSGFEPIMCPHSWNALIAPARALPLRVCAWVIISLLASLPIKSRAADVIAKDSVGGGFELGSHLSCNGQWHTLAAVDPAMQQGDYDSLNGVSALTPADVWAVGQFHVFSGTGYDQTLAEHWDGAQWTLVPTPTPLKPISVLNGVAAIGSRDVWAVGYEQDVGFSSPYLSLIEHWDGKAWTIVQNGTYDAYLTSVSAFASDDIWAVGTTNFPGLGVIEHWDGNTWTYMNLTVAEFRAVTAIAHDDVWVVGQNYAASGNENSLAIHYDGAKWTQFPTPNPLMKHPGCDENWLTSITAISSADIWATLVARDTDFGILDHTFAVHWDGNTWRLRRTQNPGGKSMYNDLWALAALAGNDVYAVGETGQITFAPLAERWDGNGWALVTTPSLQGVLLALTRVPTRAALFATGNQVVQNSYNGTLVEYVCPAAK